MTIERGEKIAVVGMNGVGKSTLLKTILGKIEPLSGKRILGDFLSLLFRARSESWGHNAD